MQLNTLSNNYRPAKRRKRVGRGIGSGLGKTCGRGVKGAGSRSGWKKRERYEGGQIPLYRKLPERGFSNARFQAKLDSINLGQIDRMFEDGETVSLQTLRDRNYMKGTTFGIKILGEGEITKKLKFEVQALSKSAEEKLKNAGLEYQIVA